VGNAGQKEEYGGYGPCRQPPKTAPTVGDKISEGERTEMAGRIKRMEDEGYYNGGASSEEYWLGLRLEGSFRVCKGMGPSTPKTRNEEASMGGPEEVLQK